MSVVNAKMVKSARRVLEVLEFFDYDHQSATVMDIARALGYPQSSTSELLSCLVGLGYLDYDRYSRVYSPTVRVGLIGAWVEPNLFRSGPLLRAVDALAAATGETVVLSTIANYAVQHIHVVPGANRRSAKLRVSDTEALLHAVQGKLLLSTYAPSYIRAVIHRLNAEEPDPERRVRPPEILEELAAARARGWALQTGSGQGAVAAILPIRRSRQRIVLSVVAPDEVIEARSDEIRALICAISLGAPTAPVRRAAEHDGPVGAVRLPQPPAHEPMAGCGTR